jgi:hypothetical protein
MIQDETPKNRFAKWLFEDIQWLMYRRFSTHEMRKLAMQEQVLGGNRKIKEIKSAKFHVCQGLHAACWGYGLRNPHSGNKVNRFGSHGHFCIIRDKKVWGDHFGTKAAPIKGILIGLEGSRPRDQQHGLFIIKAKDQYGGAHGTGGKSGEFSPTGSQKWRYLRMGPGCLYENGDTYDPKSPKKRQKESGEHKPYDPPVADTLLIIIDRQKMAKIQKEHIAFSPIGDQHWFQLLRSPALTFPVRSPINQDVYKTYLGHLGGSDCWQEVRSPKGGMLKPKGVFRVDLPAPAQAKKLRRGELQSPQPRPPSDGWCETCQREFKGEHECD